MEATLTAREAQTRRTLLALLDGAFTWFFFTYVFVTVFLPGGSFYGVNFKAPLYVGLLPLAAYSVFRLKQSTPTHLELLVAVPTTLAAWIVLAQIYGFGPASSYRQYLDILLTLLLCWLTVVFCNGDDGRRLRFLRMVLNSVIATAMLKIGLIAYAVLRGIPVVEMVAWLSKVFGFDLMTMDLGALFGRVQFVSDELIPVCIYLVLRHRDRLHLGNLRASLTTLLLMTSVLFSFSRYFWGFTLFAFALGLLLGKRDRFQAVLAGVLGVVFLASLPVLIVLYQLRFSQEVAGSSDLQRAEQIQALENQFVDAPLLGHGLGSYANWVLRDTTEAGRYSYEVQYLALPGQIGLLGMVFLLALASYYYRALWWRSSMSPRDRIGLTLLLLFWLAAGLSNPLLFHPVAGINYATLAMLAGMAARQEQRSSATMTNGRILRPSLAQRSEPA